MDLSFRHMTKHKLKLIIPIHINETSFSNITHKILQFHVNVLRVLYSSCSKGCMVGKSEDIKTITNTVKVLICVGIKLCDFPHSK